MEELPALNLDANIGEEAIEVDRNDNSFAPDSLTTLGNMPALGPPFDQPRRRDPPVPSVDAWVSGEETLPPIDLSGWPNFNGNVVEKTK